MYLSGLELTRHCIQCQDEFQPIKDGNDRTSAFDCYSLECFFGGDAVLCIPDSSASKMTSYGLRPSLGDFVALLCSSCTHEVALS
jgi:hypothetical protein